ncbi:MAG: hypothetical protein AAGD05_00325 [Bacteroidota bacterium]
MKRKSALYRLLFLLAGLCLGVWACQPTEEQPTDNDRLLAQVFNKSLFHSELEGMVPPNSSPEDSALIANAYIEKWVRESLLMHEAERNIPKDLNIDELVRDYRASLIRHNYEQLLIELQLDSTITDDELAFYYAKNKAQYQLEYPILRCLFIKIPQGAPDIDQLQTWWEDNQMEESYTKIVDYCSKNAAVYVLNDSMWYKMEDIASQIPVNDRKKLSSKRELALEDENFQYFIRVLETISERQIAPLPYVKNQISKVILHKRKIKLLDEKREEMYERETRRNNVKIFSER